MKHIALFPAVSLAGGAAAFALRLYHLRAGFEPATGLPVPGHWSGAVLLGWLIVLAAALTALSRTLPRDSEDGPAFPAAFSTDRDGLLALPAAGGLLLLLSALADLTEALTRTSLLSRLKAAADPYGAQALSPGALDARAQLLLGAFSLLGAAALLMAAAACRRRTRPVAFNGNLLLIFPVALVVRLVLVYRMVSVNPSLGAYYVELLALAFLTLTFYRLSSFAFQAGRTARFARYAGLAAVFSLAALADGTPLLSSLLLYVGGAVTALGFLLLRLAADSGSPAAEPPRDEPA